MPDGEIRYASRSQRDLDDLTPRDRAHILEDIELLFRYTVPTAQIKKLKGLVPPVWQLDSGAFRIFFRREPPHLWILGVLRKPELSRRLRHWR